MLKNDDSEFPSLTLVPNWPNDDRHLSPCAFLAFEVRPTDDVHLAHDLVRHCSELELEVARKREEDGFRLCRVHINITITL